MSKIQKIDPIIRSVTVTKKVKKVWLTHDGGLVEVYKNNRKVAEFDLRDFNLRWSSNRK